MNRGEELEDLREEIRKVTAEIIKLCGTRLSLAERVGEIKLMRSLPIEDSDVEDELRQAVLEDCRLYGVDSEFGIRLLDLLLEESKRLQGNIMNQRR
ncbi:MAG: chorismate mutase [Candidatus Bathyarchaeia archaeon]